MSDGNGRSHVLSTVGRLVGAEPTESSVKGTYLGSEVRFSYTPIEDEDRSTSIDVEIPFGCPLVVQLRPSQSEASGEEFAVLHGMLFGIAAPMDLVKHLFDRSFCESLCAIGTSFELSTMELRLRDYVSWGDAPLLDEISSEARAEWRDRKLLLLRIPHWIEDTATALRAIEVMMSAARLLPEAQKHADAALAIVHDGAPYRGAPQNPQSLIATREREIARARRAIAKQGQHSAGLLVVVTILLAPLSLIGSVIDLMVGLVRRLSR